MSGMRCVRQFILSVIASVLGLLIAFYLIGPALFGPLH
jgi:hypothetical protein